MGDRPFKFSPMLGRISTLPGLLSLGSAAVFLLVLLLRPRPEVSLSPLTHAGAGKASAAREPSLLTFEDVSLELGIAVEHEQSSDPLSSLAETLGGGVCAFDFDRDAFVDLFVVGGKGHTREYGRGAWWREALGNRLLRNVGGRKFEDVTAAAKLETPMWGMGCAVADLDSDGLQDLLVTGLGGNRLFRNRGNATFQDVTQHSGIAADHWSTGAAIADFNGDGQLDVYVSNYVMYEKGARTFERMSGFRPTSDEAFDPTLYDPEPNRLYVNRGGLRFDEVAEELGVADALGRGLGARFADINADGWPDLLVINDHETPNQLFLNQGGKRFIRASPALAAFEVAGAHDLAIADFDNDARAEVFMSRGRGRPPVLLAFSDAESRYKDEAWTWGLASLQRLPLSGWAAVPADLDNDGYLDLFVANGSVAPDVDTPFVPQGQASQLFVNDRHRGFRAQPATPRGQLPRSARGAISVDVDNDGQLELVVANNNDSLEVLRAAPTQNHWLALELNGAQHDVEAFGAIVSVRTPTFTITQTAAPAQRFLSQGDSRLHFGLGQATRVSRLEIAWPNGESSVFWDVSADQLLSVDRRTNTLVPRGHSPEPDSAFASAVRGKEPAELACLSRILLSGPPGEKDLDAVWALWRLAPAAVRVSILEHLPEPFGARHVGLLEKGLADPAAAVRLTAIARLRRAELERSIVRLLPLLDDPEVTVQCAAAETFRFFFDEEEAVIHRKGLAVAPLIRMMANGTAEAQACAAHALAAAENTRAVLPLIERAQTAREPFVQAAAIRALGHIRDARATAPLEVIAANPRSDPSVVAATLIALCRLEDSTAEATLAQVLSLAPNSSEDARARSYELLAELLSSTERELLRKLALDKQLEALLAKSPPRSSKGSVQRAALRALASSRSPRVLGALARMSFDSHVDVRVEALAAMARIDREAGARILRTRLSAESPAVLESVLSRLSKEDPTLVAQLIGGLFDRSGGSAAALRILRALPSSAASDALAGLLQGRRPQGQVLELMALCEAPAIGLETPIRGYDKHPMLELRARHALCLLKGRAESIAAGAEPQEVMQARGMLSATLAEAELPSSVRLPILFAAARVDPVMADTLLIRELPSLSAESLREALDALAATGTRAAAQDYLLQLLGDTQQSKQLRLLAAGLLAKSHRERVLEHLYARLEQR